MIWVFVGIVVVLFVFGQRDDVPLAQNDPELRPDGLDPRNPDTAEYLAKVDAKESKND